MTNFSLLTIQHSCRFFGNSGVPELEKESQDVEKMISSLFELFGAVVISDFVPYLSFVTRLQGHAAKFAKVRDFSVKLTEKIFDLDNHRQLYKERRNDPNYVPDLEDVILETPLDDGMFLPDKDILMILQVHFRFENCTFSSMLIELVEK